MGKFIDLTGEKFGRLTVIKRAESNQMRSRWLCICECGNECIVYASHLKSGDTKSCGCLQKELSSIRLKNQSIKHGMYNTRLYNIWKLMKQRCYNPKASKYKNYGGRGIKVCEKWQKFNPFYDWAINNNYNDSLTIDRIDINGDYEPQNCRWITNHEQQFNRTNNDFIKYKNEVKTLTEWAKEININSKTLWARIHRKKWDIEKAIETPVQKNKTKGII